MWAEQGSRASNGSPANPAWLSVSAWLPPQTERTVGHQPHPGLLSVAAPNGRDAAPEPNHDEAFHHSARTPDRSGGAGRPPRPRTRAPARRRPARGGAVPAQDWAVA